MRRLVAPLIMLMLAIAPSSALAGSQDVAATHKAIIAEQSRRPAKSPAWRVLHAAESVIGDQKINRHPSARRPARKSRP